ncbi:protein windpipe [Musca domestica]|uniref:Leucine Rich repeat protein n=1 Tax=Musca domestica TaxID=7370 RepID=T1PMW8_MUSDO|nr:protein windpipe [Musca domestica]XP_058976014.1 protein windpipe [Musca domestica]XP_058976015.1 protein windpipe [Musca domestica]XP_058976016.1 protein windpipe [Musca domestica]XP_058976017.1 protein windpipe [Musca domestica]XP_058976018.1 protein windpipe [Musca domestica]XP_058976019.1 protein windpipe [Musca domestica]XP_058976020.1 protein windpipe [Musca domestica]XP_058976021.1 protein windpipe [Musca domestica]XP_058976022.1 protein windpipe [Musca domestica]
MTSSTTTRRSYTWSLALCSILLASVARATPDFTATSSAPSSSSTDHFKADQNYLCPEDCHCVLAHNTHKPFLHAKCSSLKGLRSDLPLTATLPVHSIDLSFLNLTRLSHSLEKLHDLTSIDLSHNDLHEIGHLGRRIKKLNLKHNRITSAKLAKMPQHLQTLNLQHNDITNLPRELTHLSHLQTLELSHNPINCSCETLEVRNWLQERHVFMEHPVTCAYPPLYKNKPWLQVKQSVVCEQEKKGWLPEEEENELMMGDQPIEGSGDDFGEEEELGKDYMPLESKTTTPKNPHISLFDELEGSGDLSEVAVPLDMLMASTTEQPHEHEEQEATTDFPEEEEEEEDGSGSGGGILFIPHLPKERVITDDFEMPESEDKDEEDEDNQPIEEPIITPDIFKEHLGIFDGDEHRPSTTEAPVSVEKEQTEEEVVKAEHVPSLAADLPAQDIKPSTEGPEADVAQAKMGEPDDSKATYLLWGVITFIVVALILYVAIKQCKNRSRNRNDAENPQTELVAMDKKQLGKPLRNGVPEHVPLIGEKTKSDMAKPINGSKPYDNGDVKDGPGQQQPLLNGNGASDAPASEEPVSRPDSQLQAPHEYYPISPRYPTPQSPRASKYNQQNAEPNNNDPDAYLPSSPKSGRYSPVYSPVTGRVKIKLGETPRPKTPMLVTRSRSNAGDIITTPLRPANQPALQSFQTPEPVHTAATNGHAGAEHH